MRTSLAVVILVAGLSTSAFAQSSLFGPEWIEQGDAGSLTNTAQTVTVNGSITRIQGALQGNALDSGASDFEDMYRVIITTPVSFYLRTDPGSGGGADFNTQLWVFDVNGFGILGNDDASDPGVGSAVFQFATDNTGVGILQPGEYFIAISGLLNRPTGNGQQIFQFDTTTEVSGPDGPGGDFAISGWDTDPNCHFGDYIISLQGVAGVPGPGALAMMISGILLGRSRRRGA